MKPFKNLRVRARFNPRTKDDLDAELVALVGTEAEFRYHRYLDDDDTPYSGQWVLISEDPRFGDYWFPQNDLEILHPQSDVEILRERDSA
ncbi:MAG: hypothetical protein PVI50_00030 [Gammaproteobacteria bacterium]|jgi:hypothetical protein